MPDRPVRIVTGCKNSMPVRVVTEGGSPVRIVTSGGDPVRIVTHGISDPVRVIGGGLAPDAPTFVGAEVGTVDASTVVITFSTDISAPCGDCSLGFTVLVNGLADAITACVIVGGNTVRLTLTTAVVFGDVVTVSYDSAVGCIMESTGVTDLATFGAQAVTNNVAAVGWWLSGGIAAANCLAAYTPKGAASLAASYDNNAAPGNGLPDGTYDAGLGTAPTWDAVNGWKFAAASSQYLTTGIVPVNGYSAFIQFTNSTNVGFFFGQLTAAGTVRFSMYNNAPTNHSYGYGANVAVVGNITAGNFGITNGAGYLNGVSEGAIGPAGAMVNAIVIGARNDAPVGGYASVYVQAFAVYNVSLTVPQAAAVAAAMAAL